MTDYFTLAKSDLRAHAEACGLAASETPELDALIAKWRNQSPGRDEVIELYRAIARLELERNAARRQRDRYAAMALSFTNRMSAMLDEHAKAVEAMGKEGGGK